MGDDDVRLNHPWAGSPRPIKRRKVTTGLMAKMLVAQTPYHVN